MPRMNESIEDRKAELRELTENTLLLRIVSALTAAALAAVFISPAPHIALVAFALLYPLFWRLAGDALFVRSLVR